MGPITRARLAGVGALAVLLLSTVFVSTSQAAHLGCGSVVTADTVLDSDIGPCDAGGLIVGADNVTLDLNGHRIFGTADQGDGAGIRVPNRTGVHITRGTVEFFDVGVLVRGGANNRISGMIVADNAAPRLGGDSGDGVLLDSTSNNVIADNDVVRNGPFTGIGVIGPSSANRVEHNRVEDNNVAALQCIGSRCRPVQIDSGIVLDAGRMGNPGATGNTVSNNVVRGNGRSGIRIGDFGGSFGSAGGNIVSRNVVQSNGVIRGPAPGGIVLLLGADRTLVEDNRVQRNVISGILVRSTENRIVNNVALHNEADDLSDQSTPGVICGLGDPNCVPAPPSCDNNVWQDNVFRTANPECAANGTQTGGPPKPERPPSPPEDVPGRGPKAG